MSAPVSRPRERPRLQRLRALASSFAKIARDPNQTAHGARLVMSFDRENTDRNYRRFADDPVGRRIVAGGPSLFDLLADREALARMPEGSLGRVYLDYMVREGLSTEALDEAVLPVEREVHGDDPGLRRFHRHQRAAHDLWHVLTGYHRDVLGEIQLIAFSRHQTHSPAFKWMTRFARIGIGRRVEGGTDLIRIAEERGRATRPLLTLDWAPLLPRPIEEVREALGTGPPPVYTRLVRSDKGFGLVPDEIGS